MEVHHAPKDCRRDSTVLFVGYQAASTFGRVILDGAKNVRISGQDVWVRATVRCINHYSAQGDRDDLVAWIAARGPVRGTLFLDHGEPDGTAAIRESVFTASPAVNVQTPATGEMFELKPSAPAKSLGSKIIASGALIGRDWQNDYAAFVAGLKQTLVNLPSDRDREVALAKMKRALKARSQSPKG